MPNFWDKSNNNFPIAQFLDFAKQNKGKTLDQMLNECVNNGTLNMNDISQEKINSIIPIAQNIMNNLGLK